MTEVVGRDIGNSMGRFIEIDKRANQSEQAKFLRIRVELPIDKPLRRGGNVVGMDGDKFWVYYKYERLPKFCFLCGIMGHDDKHCQAYPDRQNATPQYGDWLRANGNGRPRNSFNSGHSAGSDNRSSGKDQTFERAPQPIPISHGGESSNSGCVQNSKNAQDSSKTDQMRGCDILGISACQAAESRVGLDNLEAGSQVQRQEGSPRDEESVPIPMETSSTQVLACDTLSNMGRNIQKPKDLPEATNPHKPTNLAQAYETSGEQQADQGVIKAQARRGRIKKLAREQGLTQGKVSEAHNSVIGLKRPGSQIFPDGEKKVYRKKKCASVTGSSSNDVISAATAVQRHREP